MNVLVVHPSSELYGSDRQLAESAAAFVGDGWRVGVVLPGPGPLTARLDGAGVRFEQFPVLRKSELAPARLFALLARTPSVVVRLARVIRAADPDVVYVNTVTLPHWVAAARLARCPVVVHVHEAEELSAPAVRRMLYAPLRAAHGVVVNSATTARVVSTACPAVLDRLVTVPNGVPDAGARPASDTVPGRLTLVSRLSPRKGVDVALEAVAALRAQGRDVSLTVCGSAFTGYGWFAEQLRTRAAQPDLSGHVEFTGFVDSVHAELGRAQVVLAPSFGESFGNAAVEAMLAQRPVVASDVQGLAEIVDDGRTGLLVPVGDVPALTGAVARLLDDPALAARLATQGRAAALERFSQDRYRRGVLDAVRGLAVRATGLGTGRTGSSVEPTGSRGGLTGSDTGSEAAPTGSGSGRTGSEAARRGSGAARAVLLVVACVVALVVAGCSGSGSSSARSSGATGSASGSSSMRPGTGAVIAGATGGASSSSPAGSASSVAPLTTAVPAPGSGNVDQTVAPRAVSTLPAVSLDRSAALGGGLVVRVAGHQLISGRATRPGEVSGPATRLALVLTNTARTAVSLDNVVVSDTDARGTPLVGLSGSPAAPFHGRLAAGASASATYVFVLAQGRHNPYTIRVSSSGGSAVVQFVGDAA